MRRLAALFATATLAGAALVAAPPATAADRASEARSERQRVIDYWTPERVRNAQPRLPILDGIPTAHRPGHGGGGGGGSVTGAPWNDASAKGMVGETTGKVLFRLGTNNYVCSGSTVTATSGLSVVLTAGHCLHNGDNKTTSWATNWMFIPAYEDGGGFSSCDATTYGCWVATKLTTTGSWYASGDFSDDAGFAVMGLGGKSTEEPKSLSEVVGTQGIAFDNLISGSLMHAFGYPAAQKYSGNDLIYCAGTAKDGVILGTAGVGCDMTGGSSGGPWLAAFSTTSATGTAVSVNSHGFRSLKDVMFGPVFDADERAAYDLALGSTLATTAKSHQL